MKRIMLLSLFTVLLTALSVGQVFTDYLVIKSAVASKEGVPIKCRTFTSTTTDTTYGFDISRVGSVELALQTIDSATIIVKYQLSLNDTNYTTVQTLDSLRQDGDGVTVKQFSTRSILVGGAKYLRWIFAFSANAHPVGTTTPKYWASQRTTQTDVNVDLSASDTLGVNVLNSLTVSGTVALADSESINVRTVPQNRWAGFDTVWFKRSDSAITYAAGNNIATSRTAASTYMFKLPNAGRVAGWGGHITAITVDVDTPYTTGSIHVWPMADSAGMTYVADGGAYTLPFTSNAVVGRRLPSAVLSFSSSGTGSATGARAEWTGRIPYQCDTGSTALYLRVTCESAFVGKVSGQWFIKVWYAKD